MAESLDEFTTGACEPTLVTVSCLNASSLEFNLMIGCRVAMGWPLIASLKCCGKLFECLICDLSEF